MGSCEGDFLLRREEVFAVLPLRTPILRARIAILRARTTILRARTGGTGGIQLSFTNGDVVYKVLVSAKKFSQYPEGVIQPSQGQRPWYMVLALASVPMGRAAVLTAAPTGHNDQWL